MSFASRFLNFGKTHSATEERDSPGYDAAGRPPQEDASRDSEEKDKASLKEEPGDAEVIEEALLVSPGELTLEEGEHLARGSLYTTWIIYCVDAAGGLGRHLGVFSCTMLM